MAEKRDELINKMSDKIVDWYDGKADWPTLVVIVQEIMDLALGEVLPQLAESQERVEHLQKMLKEHQGALGDATKIYSEKMEKRVKVLGEALRPFAEADYDSGWYRDFGADEYKAAKAALTEKPEDKE